jgi:peptidoglycan/LPS O-acetylase OafA/YrhL
MHTDPHRNLGLDAIRAAAILMVLLSHFSDMSASYVGATAPAWLSIAGLFGVELFFVLSGFLIGGILLRLIATRPTWRDWLVFMIRRWMRTLPLYLLWLAVLALLFPPATDRAGHLLHYLMLTQNLGWPMPADNWFGVSWSLTVEEWFYLSFSLALLGAAALSRWRGVAWTVIGVFIAVPLAIRLLHPAGPDFLVTTYKIAGLRLDAIACGVALARLRQDGSRLFAIPRLALLAGLGLLTALWLQASVAPFAIPLRVFLQAMPTVTSVGCALLFPAALRLRGRRGWLGAAIRQISAQSYSLYLVHLTVLEAMWLPIAGLGVPALAAGPLALVLSFAISWLLWRYVERPVLDLRPTRLPSPRVTA